MQRFALKKISLEQVLNEYENIVKNTHFILPGKPLPENDPNLKPISSDAVEILMILGLDGVHLLSRVLREKTSVKLSDEDMYEIYCKCDGFGKRSREELLQINDGWDWSHVRDSSPDAIKEAVQLAKQKIVDIYNSL